MDGERELRTTFDRAARLYGRARPGYPEELYSDLLELTGIVPPGPLLEVGCGPGVATEPLARRGFAITAVELGGALAGEARRRLAAFPGVRVVNAAFEDWEPPEGRFGLGYAATAWKWIDPQVRCVKAARALAPGGHLAVWSAGHAFPADADPFFAEIQRVYEEIGEGRGEVWPPPRPEQLADPVAEEFERSGRFDVVGTRRYVWALRYTAEEYLALLDTFSGHIAMAADKRAHLYREIRRRLAERPDGRLTRHWVAILTVGRRRRD